jgi:hypothetical protein
MQFSIKHAAINMGVAVAATLVLSMNVAHADADKTTKKSANKVATNKVTTKASYNEDQFLNEFSGKMKTVVIAKLGEPVKKETSVKPAGASSFLQKAGADEKESKRVNVEMWYYKDLVNYDPKNKYKETEITFVNDKVMNIAFFNNR